MSKENIKFSLHHLLIDGDRVAQDTLASIKDRYVFAAEDDVSATVEVENTNDYLWVYAQTGKSFPRSDKVLNIITKEEEQNPRSANQAELRNQAFYLYLYSTGILYASTYISLLKKLLAEVNEKVAIRHVYKTREEFLASIKRIKSVRFIAEHDLLNWNENLFSIPGDKLGLGSPKQIKVDYNFGGVSATEGFRNFIRHKGFAGCDQGTLSSLVVAGDYAEGDSLVAATFNLKNLESSISIQERRNESMMFDESAVKEALLAKVTS